MDSKYLSSLIAAIEYGSIAKAARNQGITAAAVSQRIQVLERELNTILLNRVGHTAKPTDAAMAILGRARLIVREVELLKSDVHADSLSGIIRIGTISTALTGILPSALMELHRQAPDIRPQIVPGTSSALFDALSRETIDAAIMVMPPFEIPKRYQWHSLHSEELILLTGESLKCDVAQTLSSYPYISYDPNSWGGRLAQQYLNDHHLNPRLLLELDGIEAISLLVKEKMGVSLLPRWPGLTRISPDLVQTAVAGGYDRRIILLSRPESVNEKLLSLLVSSLRTAGEA